MLLSSLLWKYYYKKNLNSFHRTAARKIAMLPITYNRENEIWIYPSTEKVLKRTKIQPLYEYLHARRKYIMPYAENLELYKKLSSQEKQSPKLLWSDDPKLEKMSITFYEEN